jgi:hypothetical protein
MNLVRNGRIGTFQFDLRCQHTPRSLWAHTLAADALSTPGTEDHEVETGGRFLRRKRRGDNPVRNRSRRNTGKYDSHDHGGNRRRGSGAPFIRRSMGSCPPNPVGLDAYHSSLGHSNGGHICSNAPFPCESITIIPCLPGIAMEAASVAQPSEGAPRGRVLHHTQNLPQRGALFIMRNGRFADQPSTKQTRAVRTPRLNRSAALR